MNANSEIMTKLVDLLDENETGKSAASLLRNMAYHGTQVPISVWFY
jgi:hypothetical protein